MTIVPWIILIYFLILCLGNIDWDQVHTYNAEGRRRQAKKIAEAVAAHETFAAKRRKHQHWNWRTNQNS